MPVLPARRSAILVVGAVMLVLAPLTATAQDLEDVRQQRGELEQGLEDLARRQEELSAAIVAKEDQIAALDAREAELEQALVTVQAALQKRARAMFKQGGDVGTLEALVSGDGPTDALERASTVDLLARRDGASLEQAEALRIQLEQTRELHAGALAELEAMQVELADAADAMNEELEDVKILERDLELQAKRQKFVERGPQQGIYACPLAAPYSFIDSWGFPRSGGRRHKGVDIMSPYGNEILAFHHGRVERLSTSRLGGISLYLRGDDGNVYYYAHLAGYAGGIGPGVRVEAGQVVGYNGTSGNARGGSPHLHFEIHPGGGSPVNPYPWVAAACY